MVHACRPCIPRPGRQLDQIAAFWQICDARSNGYNVTSSALKLLLVLIQRPSEVSG
ncbi:MAG TPA: hypothetical protein VFR31_03895 [Thermoanaerobaculia bacterium]|nr:hypothetical protein [Thermoanaerobaculia bacterium]